MHAPRNTAVPDLGSALHGAGVTELDADALAALSRDAAVAPSEPARTFPRGFRLTRRDRAMVVALARRVRLITPHQAALGWWPDVPTGLSQATHRLGMLESEGYVCAVQVHVRRHLPLTSPVCAWSPGAPPPPFATAARALKARWGSVERARRPAGVGSEIQGGDFIWQRAFAATRRGVRVFGAGASRRGPGPASACAAGIAGHDHAEHEPWPWWRSLAGVNAHWRTTHALHVTSVFIHALRTRPFIAERWIAPRGRLGMRLCRKWPDALVHETDRGGQERPALVLEFGDAHGDQRLRAFHESCAAQELAYEVW